MKYGKRRINAVGIFAVALVVFGASPSQAIDELKMRVDWVPYIMHAPFYLAAEKGWYKERGLDVKIDDRTGSSVTVQMVATGSYDASFAMQSAMAPGRNKGMMVKAIAGLVSGATAGSIDRHGKRVRGRSSAIADCQSNRVDALYIWSDRCNGRGGIADAGGSTGVGRSGTATGGRRGHDVPRIGEGVAIGI